MGLKMSVKNDLMTRKGPNGSGGHGLQQRGAG
jgi:hypothetical protein